MLSQHLRVIPSNNNNSNNNRALHLEQRLRMIGPIMVFPLCTSLCGQRQPYVFQISVTRSLHIQLEQWIYVLGTACKLDCLGHVILALRVYVSKAYRAKQSLLSIKWPHATPTYLSVIFVFFL